MYLRQLDRYLKRKNSEAFICFLHACEVLAILIVHVNVKLEFQC